MAICFVIQPFDSGKFDKRFLDIYQPAIESAGLEAYRVDNDSSVLVPIESIEKGIRQAVICLADITTDNPNVWYELGFAFAAGRPVVMVCSEERTSNKYPFDIQHRSVISYLTDAPSDFDKLRDKLTAKIKSIMNQDNLLDQIAESDPVAAVNGLSQSEIMVLAVIAGETSMPDKPTTVYSIRHGAERAGITNMGVNLALRRLLQKKFASEIELYDDRNGEPYTAVMITDVGWEWIDANDSHFQLNFPVIEHEDKDIPF